MLWRLPMSCTSHLALPADQRLLLLLHASHQDGGDLGQSGNGSNIAPASCAASLLLLI